MEQKRLDEIEEETYFGEEFVEEDFSVQKIKKEKQKEKKESKPKPKKAAKKPFVKAVKNSVNKVEPKSKEEPKPEIKVTPAKESLQVSAPPIDPWSANESDHSIFGDAGTWKIITGILVILLVASVFTSGFSFSNATPTSITLDQAKAKTLSYVNDNLLQPPFTAEISDAQDLGNFYQLTLSVAGQDVESYLTKDGKMFFPQGFALDEVKAAATEKVAVSLDDDAVKGAEDAPVTIIEFSDFECPFCGRYIKETYPQIVKDYVNTGKVKYVFRDFPLEFHTEAQKAAEAAECAGQQDKYWEMHDQLFANQDKLDLESLKGYAKKLGLDTEKFNTCLTSGVMAPEVKKDLAAGQEYGVSGTPAFFINGKLLSGALPYATFKQEIDAALAQANGEEAAPVKEEAQPAAETKPAAEKPVAEVKPTAAASGDVQMISINAKRWLFAPNSIKVKSGNTIKLIITSSGLDFTFSIPDYAVEQQVSGPTTVEFVATNTGTFAFKCSSCEDWRGMTGTIVVE